MKQVLINNTDTNWILDTVGGNITFQYYLKIFYMDTAWHALLCLTCRVVEWFTLTDNLRKLVQLFYHFWDHLRWLTQHRPSLCCCSPEWSFIRLFHPHSDTECLIQVQECIHLMFVKETRNIHPRVCDIFTIQWTFHHQMARTDCQVFFVFLGRPSETSHS